MRPEDPRGRDEETMKSCHDVDEIMTAYVDGEVPADEAAEVDAHLALCPPCQARASSEGVARQVLQVTAATLVERAPPGLRARCIAATPGANPPDRAGGIAGIPRQRLSGWVPLSMAATVLLAVGAVFIVGQNKQLEAAFAAQLAIDHDRCFTHVEDIVAGFDEEHAESVLENTLGVDTVVPPESADLDLLDVRQCLYDEGAMAHVLCEWRGQPVSLFVVPGRSDREQILEIVGHDAVIWSGDGNAYALVAEQGPVEISRVAEYVRQYLD